MALENILKSTPVKNMKYAALGLGGLLLSALPTFGQAQVQGRVELGNRYVSDAGIELKLLEDTTQVFSTTTDGNGIYRFSGVTDVEENPVTVPTKFTIKEVAVSGNPGKEQEINTISEEKEDFVRIYDIKGSLVATLPTQYSHHNQILNAHWNGRNDNNQPVAEGVYLVRAGKNTGKIVHLDNGVIAGKNGVDSRVIQHFDFLKKQAEQKQSTQAQALTKSSEEGTPYQLRIFPTEESVEFAEKIRTVKLVDGFNSLRDTVYQWENLLTIAGNISEMYNDNGVDGVIVKYFDEDKQAFVDTTDAQGNYRLPNMKGNEVYTYELSKAGGEYFDVKFNGQKYVLPRESFADTMRVINSFMTPTKWKVPGTEEYVNVSKEFIDLTFNTNENGTTMNPEEALRHVNLYIGSLTETAQQVLKQNIANAVAELYDNGQSPFVYVDYTLDNPLGYHPYDNYHEGEVGWNIYSGSNLTFPAIQTFGSDYLIRGGKIELSGAGPLVDMKEIFFRRHDFRDTMYGIMTSNARDPATDDQKAAYWAKVMFEKNTFEKNTYRMAHLVDPEN